MRKLVLLFLISTLSHLALATNYKIDVAHTNLGFKVKHLVISTVNGRFNKFDGSFKFDEKTGVLSDVKLTIQADSIDTNEPDRDKHLKSSDFFDVEKFKTVEFVSNKISKKSKGNYEVAGDLTIHGIKKAVKFKAEINGPVIDPWKNSKLAFNITSKLKRADYGLTWNKTLDQGGVVVDENVNIIIEGESLAE